MNKLQKDTVESKRVATNVRAKPQRCFGNAFRVVMNIPEYAQADYVEGMVVIGRAVAHEHGWVEKDGVIIDPTLPNDDLDYFPGLRFKGQQGLARAMQISKPKYTVEDLPIFYRFGWGGVDSPKFRAAMIAAYRYVGMEDLARQYEDYKPRCAVKAGVA